MTTRRQLLAASVGLAALPLSNAHAQAPAFAEALAQTFAEGNVPALAGMVVGPHGPLWTGAHGQRRAGNADAVTADDHWHLGSNTKAMTAAIYGRLVDQGLARWDARLPDLLPDVPMSTEWENTSIVDVMSHSAGLIDAQILGPTWLASAHADTRPVVEQRRALARTMLAASPGGMAGSFAYANANYLLMGTIIERITGQAWEAVMAEQLFAPLAIKSGGFGAPVGAHPWGHLQGGAVDPSIIGSDNPRAMGPAGTAHMSLSDYGRFLRELLVEDSEWLSTATRLVLMQPGNVGPPEYGGGWLIIDGQAWAQGPVLTHDGSNTLWYASTVLAPGLKRAFVAVSNDAAQGATACQQLIGRLVRAI